MFGIMGKTMVPFLCQNVHKKDVDKSTSYLYDDNAWFETQTIRRTYDSTI